MSDQLRILSPVKSFYVETSVWGCVAPRQPRDRKRLVKQLLALLDGEKGVCVISDAVTEEIAKAPDTIVLSIQRFIDETQPVVYPVTPAVEALAQEYIKAAVVPPKRLTDAAHVAAATCYGCDFLVSWNHRHMTRPTKRVQFESVNQLHGHKNTPLICNPLEAIDELRHG